MRLGLSAKLVLSCVVATLLMVDVPSAQAQFFRGGAVGGVSIDPNGVVSAPQVGAAPEMMAAWQAGLQPAPADMRAFADLRFVSLKNLEAQVAKHLAAGEPIPDELNYLAGLLRIKYVLVYPEQGDIVLAGPAEGWKVDRLGNTVGLTSNRPVLMLDDLVVALRSTATQGGPVISCSIDPTEEGLRRVQEVIGQFNRSTPTSVAGRRMEEALGPQVITVTGLPADSHFARTIVAADFRMKRLAMNFEPAPIGGLPSYLQMASSAGDAFPRWWLATNYEPVLQDKQGLAWEIRGQGVKCMTETDFVNAQGERTRSGKVSPAAKKWADRFTERFEDLANEDSSFGQLRNVMDLSVAASLLHKEGLLDHAGLKLPALMTAYELEQYPAPREVPTQASFIKKRNERVVSASGGVQMLPWYVAENIEQSDQLDPVRQQAAAGAGANWWWQ